MISSHSPYRHQFWSLNWISKVVPMSTPSNTWFLGPIFVCPPPFPPLNKISIGSAIFAGSLVCPTHICSHSVHMIKMIIWIMKFYKWEEYSKHCHLTLFSCKILWSLLQFRGTCILLFGQWKKCTMTKCSYPNELLHVNFGGYYLWGFHLNDIQVGVVIKRNYGTLNKCRYILQQVGHQPMNTWNGTVQTLPVTFVSFQLTLA